MKILSGYIIFLVFLIPLFLGGCADKIVSIDDLKPDGNSGQVQLSKFSEIQKAVFASNCALSGCHSGANPQAGLDLSEGKAYNSLVNKQSILYPQFLRVSPNSSGSSLLIKVLSGTVATVMPPTGKLNQNIIDSISVWINKGAKND